MIHSLQKKALRYLLGLCSLREAVEVEKRYFTDDDFFEELSALENELMDAFVRDELSAPERQKFERGYLISPARRANVEFAKALAHYLDQRRQTGNFFLDFISSLRKRFA